MGEKIKKVRSWISARKAVIATVFITIGTIFIFLNGYCQSEKSDMEARLIYQTGLLNSAESAFAANDTELQLQQEIAVWCHDVPQTTIIEKGSVLFSFERRQFSFQLFVVVTVPAHHSGAHGGCHAETGGGFGVYLPDFGVIGEAEVVIEAPDDLFLTAERHSAADLPF